MRFDQVIRHCSKDRLMEKCRARHCREGSDRIEFRVNRTELCPCVHVNAHDVVKSYDDAFTFSRYTARTKQTGE